MQPQNINILGFSWGWGVSKTCLCVSWGSLLMGGGQKAHQQTRNLRTVPGLRSLYVLLGQKSCRTKVSRIFGIFAPNFAPNFPRSFRGLVVLRFAGDGDQKKFTKNPRHFWMQNSQANTKKIFTKVFWRAGQWFFSANCSERSRSADKCSSTFPLCALHLYFLQSIATAARINYEAGENVWMQRSCFQLQLFCLQWESLSEPPTRIASKEAQM